MHYDDKYQQLSRPKPNGQSLWCYLLHGPRTLIVPGLLPIGLGTVAEDLKWPTSGTRKAWLEIARLGMAEANWNAPLIWLPHGTRHNAPQSPNVVRAWRACFDDEIPPCPLKTVAERYIEAFLKGFAEGFREAFLKGSAKEPARALPNQEQEQDQETGSGVPDQNSKRSEAHAPAVTRARPDPGGEGLTNGQLRHAVLEVVSAWNRQARDPFVLVRDDLSAPSHRRIERALEGHPDVDWWTTLFAEVFASTFLAGGGERGWVADFWWVLEHADEIAQGRYRDRQGTTARAAKTAGNHAELARFAARRSE
jgi:hypothetical protein